MEIRDNITRQNLTEALFRTHLRVLDLSYRQAFAKEVARIARHNRLPTSTAYAMAAAIADKTTQILATSTHQEILDAIEKAL